MSGNTATDDGGGVANRVLGVLTVLNSTISGNIAGDVGGGVMNSTMSVLTVLNSTISDNVAGGAGGGIWHSGATATLKNSIVAGNTAADCDGAVVSIDNNLDSDGTCNLIATRDLSGVDPLLGPLASNGGPTQTRALLLGSPAINAGNDVGAPPTDQRGFPGSASATSARSSFKGSTPTATALTTSRRAGPIAMTATRPSSRAPPRSPTTALTRTATAAT